MSTFKVKPIILAIAALHLGITGCGGSDQDEGTPSKVAVSGLGLDGYLARSEVFQDLNNNGVRDVFEPSAYTDDMGYYSYNPETSTNYCTSSNTVLRNKHCLEALTGEYPIVVQGGYDLITGEPFHGMLRKNVDSRTDRPISQMDFISPITTLLSHATSTELPSFKTQLGIVDADLNRDFYNRSSLTINQADDFATDRKLLELTQKIHKTVSAAAQISEKVYNVKDEAKLPKDTSSYIYKALATELLVDVNNFTVDTVLQTNLTSVMTRAKTLIETDYTAKKVTIPNVALPEILSADDISNVSNIPNIVTTLVDSLALDVTSIDTTSSTKGTVKLIELAMKKIASQKPTTEITDFKSLIINQTDLSTVRNALALESTNISTLLDIDVSNTTNVTNATTVNYDPVFTELGLKRLALGESNVQEETDYAAIIYFEEASEGSTSGNMVACVRYVDGITNGTLDTGGTLGTYSGLGSWSSLNGGFALMLDFEIAGAKRQATVQYGGTNDQQEHIYRTDIDDELRTWTGNQAPAAFEGEVPTSDAECKTAIETEFGVVSGVNS